MSFCLCHYVGCQCRNFDNDIDNVLGLVVFYQHVRTAALNQRGQTEHVIVFTTELFAYYLHIRYLSVTRSLKHT